MVFRMTNKENLYRPGISGETLETHQIVRVDEKESKFKTGIRASGLLIPYFCCKRKLVWCNSHDFFRIRLDDPIEGMKYHQRKGSGVHPYLPLGLWDLINEDVDSLVVVEGEFKALSLIEAGIPAVGISGFYGFADGDFLVRELSLLFDRFCPSEILFLGDSDTSVNWQFSDAAVKLKSILRNKGRIFRLPRLPLDGPKGIDDLREKCLRESENPETGRANFLRRWESMKADAVEVTSDLGPDDLALILFRQVVGSLPSVSGERKTWTLKKLAALASSLGVTEANEVREAVEEMGVGKREFNAMVTDVKKRNAKKSKESFFEFDVEMEDVWFAPYSRMYWILENGNWIPMDEKSISRWLLDKGVSGKVAEGARQSQLAESLLGIQTKKTIDADMPLAGYLKGVRRIGDARILVAREANQISAVKGDWDLVRDLVEALLKDVDGSMTPVYVFYEWTKIFLDCLETEIFRNGQALVLAGPIDCGKSLLQNLLTILFGGREGRPYQYASGGTSFNADLARAEHLVIEDEASEGDWTVRKKTGALLKQYAANKMTRVHPKGKDAYVVELLNRLTMTMNDDSRSLGILPPIDESLSDKIILLQAHKRDLPRKPQDSEEYEAFRKDLEDRLPAFKHYLMYEFNCPEELKSPRFGVVAHHDPGLFAALSDFSPEERFQALLECCVGTLLPVANESRSFGAAELATMLIDEDFPCREEAGKLLQTHESVDAAAISVGTLMGNLKSKRPDLVRFHRTSETRSWLINPEQIEDQYLIPEKRINPS